MELCHVLDGDDQSMVHFLLEASMPSQSLALKQICSDGRYRYHYLNHGIPLTLHDSLEQQRWQSFRAKRIVALSCAYALLQLHGNDIVSETLKRDGIYFYALTDSMIDYCRPFLKADLASTTQAKPALNASLLQHRSPSILNLGIIMIELDKGMLWSTIPGFDKNKRSAHRDVRLARHLLHSIESPEYREAVQACVSITWVKAGITIDLGDRAIREAYARAILMPLMKELKFLNLV